MPVFRAISTEIVDAYRSGGLDVFGNIPERQISDGNGNPCRHCLREIPKGVEMLVSALKPFAETQPYAEVGPIFLCAAPCQRGGGPDVSEILTTSPDYLVKGHCVQDRIVYGTGAVIEAPEITDRVSEILADPGVAYIHIRSALNTCYQVRVDRDD
ncbi:DUF1203 domain-containing protein [Tateyamaria pelophila]|uniref:DUF1203 domain-containing protein n=1 Tax=Tateyamaria pelophila TaxID=328415 RepID=UPI001CC0BC00|nr:DUF1203 domain-containing protein [Tateyamaria pelophila]